MITVIIIFITFHIVHGPWYVMVFVGTLGSLTFPLEGHTQTHRNLTKHVFHTKRAIVVYHNQKACPNYHQTKVFTFISIIELPGEEIIIYLGSQEQEHYDDHYHSANSDDPASLFPNRFLMFNRFMDVNISGIDVITRLFDLKFNLIK